MSLAKLADVTCQVKPEGRRPDPLFNIASTSPGLAHEKPEYEYGFLENRIKITRIYCRLTLCFRRHFAMFEDTSQVRACCSIVQMNG